MCIMSSPSVPSAPPPPPPPPEPPTPADPQVAAARKNARTVGARAAGRGSTLLGGELTAPPENETTKTLLGQ